MNEGRLTLRERFVKRGFRGEAPRRGGRQRLALDSSTPLRFAQNDTEQGFDEGEASPPH